MPKRGADTESASADLLFGGAIGGILVLLGIGALIGKCMAGKKSEVNVNYEM